MDGWMDRWTNCDWNWKTLLNHGSLIKSYIYECLYIISVLPKSCASNRFSLIFFKFLQL